VLAIVCGDGSGAAQQLADIDRSWSHRRRAGLHALQVEQVVQELSDAKAFVAHRLEVFALPFGRPLVVEQQLGKPEKGRDEITHLMAEDGDRIHCWQ
jgi:hypothetical protein